MAEGQVSTIAKVIENNLGYWIDDVRPIDKDRCELIAKKILALIGADSTGTNSGHSGRCESDE